MTASSRFEKNRLLLMVVILLLGFALQLVVLRQLAAHSPFIYNLPPAVDQVVYISNARAFLTGDWPGATPFELAPYESLFLGLTFALGGDMDGLFFPRLLQALIGTLTIALTYKLGQWAFKTGIGLAAALVLALYSPAIFYNLELTTAPHTTLWVTLALLLMLAYDRWRQWRYPALAGLVIGVAALARPNALIILGGMGLWLLSLRLPRRQKWTAILLMGGAALLPLLWPMAHNTVLLGQPTFITTTGAYNLYIGNNPEATGVFISLPEDLIAAVAAGEASYTAETLRYIAAQPGDWLAMLGQKLVMALVSSDMELGSNVNYHYWGVRFSSVLGILQPLRYDLLVLLALFGLIMVRRRKGARLLYLTWGVYLLSMVIFFVQARFRLAMVPALAVLAAATVFEMARRYRRGDKKVLLLVFALVLAYVALLIRYVYLLSGGVQIVS